MLGDFTGTPQQYAKMYSKSRKALHKVDPQSSATLGGMARPTAPQYLRDLLPMLKNKVDAVGAHTYGSGPGAAATSWKDLKDVRRVMNRSMGKRRSRNTPIDVTEFGDCESSHGTPWDRRSISAEW